MEYRWYQILMPHASKAATWALVLVVVLVTALIVWLSVSLSGFDDLWYQNLTKPPGLAPPPVFGIVWTILYILIFSGAVYAVVTASNFEKKAQFIILYILALLLTLMWIVTFNLYREPPVSLAVILLTLVVVGCICWSVMPGKLREMSTRWDVLPGVAFALLFTWLVVASYYNLAIVALNPGGGSGNTEERKTRNPRS